MLAHVVRRGLTRGDRACGAAFAVIKVAMPMPSSTRLMCRDNSSGYLGLRSTSATNTTLPCRLLHLACTSAGPSACHCLIYMPTSDTTVSTGSPVYLGRYLVHVRTIRMLWRGVRHHPLRVRCCCLTCRASIRACLPCYCNWSNVHCQATWLRAHAGSIATRSLIPYIRCCLQELTLLS